MCIMKGNLFNELTLMLSFTNTHKDGVGAMVYAPNVDGTQINLYLATCLITKNYATPVKGYFLSLPIKKQLRQI